ncbi:sensor domain-containing diguanylate cyclase [Musicola paradisiaca]|uniref:Diguanylate cyclase with PAS/PAC and GAF sensors n=1 Tax=Musicola paradisiaca (strain Ech703) TaxID=579405 RepID=C6C700_MUSP7|nr:diguanylate cyclase [Musicola paradisiaca]ACS85894.1 diguanylate cyclase with PAS/PAC and GAF sensors [Musicola paradisiaca Ech703]
MSPLRHRSDKHQQRVLARMLKIFESQPAEELQRLIRIVQSYFQVKSVVISLLDDHRQWFLYHCNFSLPEPPINHSFCVHTVDGDAPLIVPDTLEDRRFANNPLVTGEPRVRFHASYPLHLSTGKAFGALCLYHDQPRLFSPPDLEQLGDLAFIVQTTLQKVEMQANAELVREKFQHMESINQQIFSRAAVGLALIMPDMKPVKINAALCNILGYSEELLLTLPVEQVVYPDDLPALIATHQRLLSGEISQDMAQRRYFRADGSVIWMLVSISALYNPNGSIFGLQVALHDLSQLKATEQALRELSQELEQRVEQRTQELMLSHQFIQDITDHIPALVSCISPDNHFTFTNRHLRKLLGDEQQDYYQQDIHNIMQPPELALFLPRLEESRQKRLPMSFEHTVHTLNNQFITYHTELVPAARPEDGTYILSTDISRLTALRDRLVFEANHDHLTGLPNRRAVINHLTRIINKKHRKPLALLFFDINNFKHYNDQFGHGFGDRVIKVFARLLRRNTRAYDFIGRLSGDEFLMVIHEQSCLPREVQIIGEKLKNRIEKPVKIFNQTITLSASIGTAFLPQGATLNINELIRQADAAMYEDKRRFQRPIKEPADEPNRAEKE